LVLAICLALSAIKSFGCEPGNPTLNCHDPLYVEVQGNGVYTVAQENDVSNRVKALQNAWLRGGMKKIAYDVDRSLDGVMRIAIRNLRHHGYRFEATEMEIGWEQHRGEVSRLLSDRSDRKITDFEPLSQFLATAFWKLHETLGDTIVRALHLDLILTFNFTIKYVFSFMCDHPEQEFYWHFVGDDPSLPLAWKGLAPATTYVLVAMGCNLATFGAGIYWLCGPLAYLAELSMTRWGAPYLSPKVFNAVCSK
jgi:hypothetical protein